MTQYTLTVLVLAEPEDYPLLLRDLAAGKQFDQLAASYTKVKLPDQGKFSRVTRAQVSEALGPYVSEALRAARPGRTSLPVASPYGPVVFWLQDVHESDGDLVKPLEEVYLNAYGLDYDYDLGRNASVVSSLAPELSKKRAAPLGKSLAIAQIQLPTTVFKTPRPQASPVKTLAGPFLPEEKPPLAAPLPRLKSKPVPLNQPSLPEIFRATTSKSRHRLLGQQIKGLRLLRLDQNDNLFADAKEPVLVKVTVTGWKPVGELNDSVDRFTMENDYGYWTDRVDRSAGQIDPEEVQLNILQPWSEDPHRYLLGVEIVRDEQGRLFHLEQVATFSQKFEIRGDDLVRLENYRANSGNWSVGAR